MEFTDVELTEMLYAGKGIDDAIKFLYQKQFTITAAYIKQNSGNDEDAEDIFQEVLLAFIELVQKQKFRGDSSISTFLYAITRNIWLNELKKRGRSKLRNEKFEKAKDSTGGDISHLITEREVKKELMQMVESIGETCKKILLAFYFENMSMKDILKTLDYENEQVVRNKKYKCLKKLEQLITAQPALVKNLKSIF